MINDLKHYLTHLNSNELERYIESMGLMEDYAKEELKSIVSLFVQYIVEKENGLRHNFSDEELLARAIACREGKQETFDRYIYHQRNTITEEELCYRTCVNKAMSRQAMLLKAIRQQNPI